MFSSIPFSRLGKPLILPSICINSALRSLCSNIDIQLSAGAYPCVHMTVTEMFMEDSGACGLAIVHNLIIGVNSMGFSKGSISQNDNKDTG